MEELDDFEHQYDSNLDALDQLQSGGAANHDPPVNNNAEQNGKRKFDAVDPNKACGRLYTVPALTSSLYAKRPRLDEEDLFGESDYTIPERSYMTIKTNKPSEHHVLTTIMKIQRARLNAGTTPFADNLTDTVEDQPELIRGEFHRKPPRDAPWISVTSSAGDLGFFKIYKNEKLLYQPVQDKSTSFVLLQQAFSDVRRDAEKIIETRMTAKFDPIIENGEGQSQPNNSVVLTEELWVEKYKPKYYTDLLSDDGINRTLLTWLKLWDECVFGLKKPTDNLTKKTVQSSTSSFGKQWKNHNQPDSDDLSTELDQYKRPQYKIALLCGPPGLGKTTLAHAIAFHAKYHPVEMNASDDRSVEHFKKQLEASTQMKATLDKDSRPHCLVIDEIDGAPTPTVDFLVNFVKGEGSAKKKTIVKRPIICICNDLYAPALRELRKIALIIQFPSTESEKLVQRLSSICKKERIRAETAVLAELVERSCYDIRSCINTLQFLKFKGQKKLDMMDVCNLALGQKDSHKGLFTVWHEIFQMPRAKRGKPFAFRKGILSGDANGDDNPISTSSRFKNILSAVNSCEDGDKLRQGLFDNLAAVPMRESKLNAWSFGLDWFNFTESVSSLAYESQYFPLLGYTSYVSVIFHLLFASQEYVKISMPISQFECQRKISRGEAILSSLLANMSPSIRPFLTGTVLVLDFLPEFCQIIQPSIRSVSIQLYSEKEKVQLKRLISTMIIYNLTYKQIRSEDGQYVYTMEPDVDLIRKFPGELNKTGGRTLTYSIKQMIAYEIEVEKVRRMSSSKDANAPLNQDEAKRNAQPLVKTSLKAKVIDQEENKVPKLDFFGRVCQPTITDSITKPKSNSVTGDIFFKFREGCSNAIRRNIRMKDLL